MSSPPEVVVALSPGEAVTRLVMGVAMERTHGVPVSPRVASDGARVPYPAKPFGGSGEFVVTLRGDATVVRLEGNPPPWPFSMGWERRQLRKLLGRHVLSWSSPSSAG